MPEEEIRDGFYSAARWRIFNRKGELRGQDLPNRPALVW